MAQERTQSAILDNAARSLAYRTARSLLLPPGREAKTINQLLANENMRKQNDYVEVGAKDVGDLLQKVGSEALTI